MATTTFDAINDNSTDANFRAWGKGLSDALAAVGMIKTADTGQIDWATVAKPASNGSYRGYEVWRFNDSLQATAPIFFRIDYGASNNNQAYPGLTMSVGTGSNGTGTITNPVGGYGQYIHSQTTGSVATSCYVYAGEGELGFCLFPKLGNAPLLGGIERSRNAAGAPTGTITNFIYQQGLMSATRASGTQLPGMTTYLYNCTAFPLSAASPAAATTAPVFPILFADGISAYWQSRLFFYAYVIDTVTGIPVTVTDRGSYLPLGSGVSTSTRTMLMKWQ